ncbi:hypothetical protein [Anaerovorax odorimutans]|uniref:hypothetical protein n=1 Tax=Anaerovorax odorimutans TaxID=109327 RepID=UPI0012EB0C68|nr:hypothetical protein [Anaerovorax odorimutans]
MMEAKKEEKEMISDYEKEALRLLDDILEQLKMLNRKVSELESNEGTIRVKLNEIRDTVYEIRRK